MAGISIPGYAVSPVSPVSPVATSYIGVPDPDWGVTIGNPVTASVPARPDPWTSEQAGYYYVNNDTGTDSGRTYGDPTAPRATIPNPMPAGAYVEVHGTYDVTTAGDIRINASGTLTEPVWVVGITGDKPNFAATNAKMLAYGSYMFMVNVDITKGASASAGIQVSSGSVGFPANNLCFRDIDINGQGATTTSGYGFSVAANSGSPVSDIVLYNSNVHDLGPTVDADQDSHIVNTGSYCSDIWILGNTLENASGSGIQIGPSSPGTESVYIAGNTVNNPRQSGIWVKYGKDVIVSQNIVHDVQDRCVGADTSPSKGVGAQYSPVRVWWIFNEIYNCRYGIRVPSTNTLNTVGEYYAIGNLIHDCDIAGGVCFTYPDGSDVWDMAAIHFQGGSTRHIVNNVIAQSSSGIHISRSSGTTTVIESNIIYDVNSSGGYHIWDYDNGSYDPDYNIHYLTDNTSSLIRWGSSTDYSTLAAFNSATGKSANSVEDNPDFTSAVTNDFTLQAISPGIDAGKEPSCYDTFETLYGINIKYGYAETARPATGSDWDIGAYER